MFRHGEMLLLPHARRIICHRNRTQRGNSSFPFHFVFRIRSCIFSIKAHISSWSRTRDTTSIRGLNHGWNRTIVSGSSTARSISGWIDPVSQQLNFWISGQLSWSYIQVAECGSSVEASNLGLFQWTELVLLGLSVVELDQNASWIFEFPDNWTCLASKSLSGRRK